MFCKARIGPFQFSDDFHYAVDWDAWERLSKREGEFLYIREPLMIHRIHSDSELVKASISRVRINEDYMVYRRFWPEMLAKVFAVMYVHLSQRTVTQQKT